MAFTSDLSTTVLVGSGSAVSKLVSVSVPEFTSYLVDNGMSRLPHNALRLSVAMFNRGWDSPAFAVAKENDSKRERERRANMLIPSERTFRNRNDAVSKLSVNQILQDLRPSWKVSNYQHCPVKRRIPLLGTLHCWQPRYGILVNGQHPKRELGTEELARKLLRACYRGDEERHSHPLFGAPRKEWEILQDYTNAGVPGMKWAVGKSQSGQVRLRKERRVYKFKSAVGNKFRHEPAKRKRGGYTKLLHIYRVKLYLTAHVPGASVTAATAVTEMVVE
ncbi:hypothetical protein B0T20DRAFT_390892 [Sordaria brevicollis]|uniref:Uncharacterized protein n=1 Tax=Sordaria brevicollis TaxID=83679 RepID=A0AAE0PJK8_SORBR|nr:hypothetical protein B0T20DRAFT_390892 [Sordaria brevicollis]